MFERDELVGDCGPPTPVKEDDHPPLLSDVDLKIESERSANEAGRRYEACNGELETSEE